ncbi:hypothetical protein [Microbacterium sp. EST19A]|uniref:hypothetical protein n=1 Tax=Microbacterium sp. EST19A TaxID=2862681 RepID=UPI001CBFE42F|nr:hypothetical protein [Microbacterium sp. EST19A]
MHIVIFIVAIVVTAVLTAGAGILVALLTPDGADWALLSGIAVGGYLLAPLLLGTLSTFWNTTGSPEAHRYHRRLLLVTAGVQVLSTVAMCVYTVLTGAPWWLTVLFTAVGVAAMAVAVRVGPFLRRADRRRAVEAAPYVYGRAEFRRDFRTILIAVVSTLVGSAAVMSALLAAFSPDEFPLVLRYAPLFAVMGGGIACVLVALRLSRRIRDLFDGDLTRANRIGKVVVRGKRIALSPEEEDLIAPFASLSWVAQAYQLAWFVLLFVTLGGTQLLRFLADPGDAMPIWFVVLFGVGFVAVLPVTIVQLRRTRRFAAGRSFSEQRTERDTNPA